VVVEAELVTLELEYFSELWTAAEEDGDFSLALLADLLEDLVPVGPSRVRPRLQAGDQVTLGLLKKTKIEEL
jgi:hypothetical protein